MKKNPKLAITLTYILIILLAAACITLFIVQTAQNGWKINSSNAVKFGVILIGLILTAVKMATKTSDGHSLRRYALHYKKEIGAAFASPNRKKERQALLKGIACVHEERHQKGIELLTVLKKSCRSRDEHFAVSLFLALNYEKSGLIDQAIATYEELLTYKPDYSRAWSNLGSIYIDKGMYEKSIHALEEAIRCDENNPYAWNNLAQTHLAASSWQKVIAPAMRALELKKDIYQAENALTIAYFAMGDQENSKKYFDSAVLHGSDASNLTSILRGLAHKNVAFGNTNGVREEVIRANGHLQRDTSLPMTEIRLPAPNDGNLSRLGGAAVDQTPPFDSTGKPMKLLAAIWCSEVRGVPHFPERGVLRFYIADNALYGIDFDHPTEQKDFRVLYDENEDGYDTAQRDDDDLSESFPIPHVLPIRLSPAFGSIRSTDYRFDKALSAALAKVGVDSLSEEESDYIYAQNTYAGHRIGGYPCFEQFDPRDDNPAWQSYDTLLLQIVSHTMTDEKGKDRNLIMFGDEGGCQFFISSEKLKNRDFSDILFWWDCA